MSIKSVILKTGAFLFLACLFLMPSMHAQAAVKKMDILNGDSRKSCQVPRDNAAAAVSQPALRPMISRMVMASLSL